MFRGRKIELYQLINGLKRNYSRNVNLNEVLIVSAVRTPIGSFMGSLSMLPSTRLGSVAIHAAAEHVKLPKTEIKEVFMGNICQSGVGQAPARQAAIFAGLDKSTVCTTVNKLGASGMKSIMLASQSIQVGSQEVVLAGGMESMSNVPYYMRRGQPAYGGVHLDDGILSDAVTDVFNKIPVAKCAENTAKKFGITRTEQDEYAIASYKRTAAAYKTETFASELVSVPIPQKNGQPDKLFDTDEEYKRVDFEKFDTMSTIFPEDGTITTGNASSLNDGAAALILTSADAAERLNLSPLARVVGFQDAETDPIDFPTAPSLAIPKLLKKSGVNKNDIALWEINEAFSVVVLANQKILDLDPSKINVHGGSISLGHPVGMSGARIVVHLVHVLKRGQKGVATICNGGGGASSIMIEKC